MTAKRYRVLDPVGLDYPTVDTRRLPKEQRTIKFAAHGKIVDDLPETSVPWLLEQGYIEAVKSGTAEPESATESAHMNSSGDLAPEPEE